MPRIPAKYDAEQKAAIVSAMLDRGENSLTARAAVDLAKHGQLTHGLAAFEMPASTAADLRKKETRKRRGLELPEVARGDLENARASLTRRLVALQHQDVEKLEREMIANRMDRSKFRDALRNQRELDALLKASGSGAAGRSVVPPDGNGKAPREPASLIDRLAAAEKAKGSGARRTSAPVPSAADSEAPTGNGTAEQQASRQPDQVTTPATDRQGVSPAEG